jgi:hypothetical protein
MTQAAAPAGAGSAYPGTGVHPDLLPVGTEVCGFWLLRHVATGSFGSVWQVESVLFPGKLYALKFSLYGPEEHAVADARAAREVQLLQQAAHENVLRVVAHGRWQHPDTGLHYVVLEWVEGGHALEVGERDAAQFPAGGEAGPEAGAGAPTGARGRGGAPGCEAGQRAGARGGR